MEELRSSGLITLANGVAGGALSTSGDFIGDAGSILLDVDFANNAADTFVVAGAASGTTNLVVNPVDLGATFSGDLVLVDAGAGTDAQAFAISSQSMEVSAFLSFELVFDAATNDFLFGLGLEPRAFEASKLGEGMQSLWYRSTDAWSDHRAEVRASQEYAHGAWGVVYGAEANREEALADPTGIATGDAVLDYSQDFYGFQGGVERPLGDNTILGITGGYLSSTLGLVQSGVNAQFDVVNIGASVSFDADGFFGEALIKYDDISGDVTDSVATGFNGELDGSAFGGRVEFGYRATSGRFYAEPRVSMDFQLSDFDALEVAGQSFRFADFDGLRGAAGIRLGADADIGEKSILGVYLDASILHEFEGDGRTTFSSALDAISFDNEPVDTYGRIEAGVTIEGEGPVSGFIQAETDVASDANGFGGRAGIRIRF